VNPKSDDLDAGRMWFEWYVDRVAHHSVRQEAREGIAYRCPCCGYQTLPERGEYDICPVCFWEDDGQDDADADTVRGGPNGRLSLTQARANFGKFGACEQRFVGNVRLPHDEERPPDPTIRSGG
jgi:hypothetical protein